MWPVIDLVDDIASFLACSPNTALIATRLGDVALLASTCRAR